MVNTTLRFRFNKLTGEVERFEVDQDKVLTAADHDRAHDRVAAELGGLLERAPLIREMGAGVAVAVTEEPERVVGEAEKEEGATPGPEKEVQR